jgi:hypothetical protein
MLKLINAACTGMTRVVTRLSRDPESGRHLQQRRWHGCDRQLARYLNQRFAQGGID